MQKLLTAAFILASLLSAQAVKADECQPVSTAHSETAAPEPIVISWDRVGGKEKWWA